MSEAEGHCDTVRVGLGDCEGVAEAEEHMEEEGVRVAMAGLALCPALTESCPEGEGEGLRVTDSEAVAETLDEKEAWPLAETVLLSWGEGEVDGEAVLQCVPPSSAAPALGEMEGVELPVALPVRVGAFGVMVAGGLGERESVGEAVSQALSEGEAVADKVGVTVLHQDRRLDSEEVRVTDTQIVEDWVCVSLRDTVRGGVGVEDLDGDLEAERVTERV